MENTPSRIAADILIASLPVKLLAHDSASTAKGLADAFTVIHAAVKAAAAEDYNSDLSNPRSLVS